MGENADSISAGSANFMNSILVFNNSMSFIFVAAALQREEESSGERICNILSSQYRIEVPNVNDVWRVRNTLRANKVDDDEYALEYVDNRAPRY